MLRQIGVHHKPDIGLVNAHAEGDRCDNNLDLIPVERLLVLVAHLRRQSCVVGKRLYAVGREKFGGRCDRVPCGAVNNAGFALMALQKFEERGRVPFWATW
jgi:hypothetical protein